MLYKSRNYMDIPSPACGDHEGTRRRIAGYWKALFKHAFDLVEDEKSVYADSFSRPDVRRFGAMDYLVRYRKNYLVVEEDLPILQQNKFHWSKAFVYRAAFLLDNHTVDPGRVRCVAFLPSDCCTRQLINILSYLRCEYFFFRFEENRPYCDLTSMPQVLRHDSEKQRPRKITMHYQKGQPTPPYKCSSPVIPILPKKKRGNPLFRLGGKNPYEDKARQLRWSRGEDQNKLVGCSKELVQNSLVALHQAEISKKEVQAELFSIAS